MHAILVKFKLILCIRVFASFDILFAHSFLYFLLGSLSLYSIPLNTIRLYSPDYFNTITVYSIYLNI
jgi:hypothetical protein